MKHVVSAGVRFRFYRCNRPALVEPACLKRGWKVMQSLSSAFWTTSVASVARVDFLGPSSYHVIQIFLKLTDLLDFDEALKVSIWNLVFIFTNNT